MAIQFGIADIHYNGQLIGCLQGVSLDFSFSVASLHCGNALYARDIRTHSGEITGSAEFADLNAYAFSTILGATRTGSELTIDNQTRPDSFEMVISIVTDGIPFTITFNKVRSTKLSMSFVRDGHLIPSFDFAVEANEDGSVGTIEVGDIS